MFVDQFGIPVIDQPLVEAVFLPDDGWHDVDRASFRFVPIPWPSGGRKSSGAPAGLTRY